LFHYVEYFKVNPIHIILSFYLILDHTIIIKIMKRKQQIYNQSKFNLFNEISNNVTSWVIKDMNKNNYINSFLKEIK